MKPFIRIETLGEEEMTKKHVKILLIMLGIDLRIKDIEVLSSFISLKGSYGENRFSSSSRTKVREKLGLSQSSLSNYINRLTKLGLIYKNDQRNRLEIREKVIPPITNELKTEYHFKIHKDETHK